MVHSSRFDFDGFASSNWSDTTNNEDAEIELLHRKYILATTIVNERPARTDFNVEMHRMPEARRQLIFRVRRQIAEGTYDTPDRWESALDRLFDAVEAEAVRS